MISVAEAVRIVGAVETTVEVVRSQPDIAEVLLGPESEGLLHTGARSLLVQFCKQPH